LTPFKVYYLSFMTSFKIWCHERGTVNL
jgi:hypothetical protein